ncbi:MAG: ribulose-phosphate 3-epimerase [Oscillibacter sp.]|nr:ribulose-phosphate 3-epimerase [Oscillibacter sp.]
MQLSVSTFYLPFDQIREEISALDKAGVDWFHVDFMDGNFVDNLGMGIQDLDAVRRCTEKTIDVHMMVQSPERYVELMAEHGADIIHIHPESAKQPAAVLQRIRRLGLKCGVAVSPSVSIASIEELLPLTDFILLMSVNPGFANQSYLEHVEKKAVRLAAMQETYGYTVIMDGAVNIEAISRLCGKGISAYVLGNRVLLDRKRECYAEAVRSIRAVWENMEKGVTT